MEVQNGKRNLKRDYVVCSDGKGGKLEKHVSFEFPGHGFVENLHIVGCCNGLVCLPITCCTSSSVDPAQVVMLWNPMIRRFLHLPKSDVESRFGKSCHTFGFVFDYVKNDYKVLRIYSGLRDKTTMIEIFRLSTGLWEVVANGPSFAHISRRSAQVDLEGIAHCIGKDGTGKLKIVSFDTQEEVFDSIGLPVNEGKYDRVLVHGWETKNKFCIWRMKEYGVVESWTKLHNFAFNISVHPLAFRMNGDILWAGRNGELISTDVEGLQKYLSTCEAATCFSSCSYYVESLVLLDQTITNGVPVSTMEESPENQMILSDDEFVNWSPPPQCLSMEVEDARGG
ncbi:hypothetical protein LIER_17783 [Lithospermum erythrorhizon]|uniref:F-box associated beta-propeller type 3 domain-containing protein n=1 Tax=Lithospermum erythrorhizon TaxID=34254 RepID=A0AAV3QE81_LITER